MNKGDRFHSLMFTGNIEKRGYQTYGEFVCDCGNLKMIRVGRVKNGNTKSCGCKAGKQKNPYGLTEQDYKKLYNAWWNMKNRCTNQKSDHFYAYGERGITVCSEWENPKTFIAWAVRNGWNPSLTIERKNVDKGYSPGNCELISKEKQARNKRNNIKLLINGEEKCLAEWCREFNFPFGKAWKRYQMYGYRDASTIFYKGDLRRRSVS